MLEEYTIPALLLCFVTGVVIGINVGMICSRSDDRTDVIPNYVFRRENLPVRYPGNNNNNFAMLGRPLEPSGKRRMASQFNY